MVMEKPQSVFKGKFLVPENCTTCMNASELLQIFGCRDDFWPPLLNFVIENRILEYRVSNSLMLETLAIEEMLTYDSH